MRFSSSARITAWTIPRSWIARPVESKSVISSSACRPALARGGRPQLADGACPTSPLATGPASSPPVLACFHSSQKRRHREIAAGSSSALPWPSAPRTARCWPGRRSPAKTMGSEPGVQVTTMSCAAASSRSPGPSRVRPRACCRRGTRVVADAGAVTGGGKAAGRPRAVDAGADQPDAPGVFAGQGRRRDRGRGARPQPGHGPAIDDRQGLPGLCVRYDDDPGHHRQPARRVLGVGGDPLHDCQAVAAAGIARKSPGGLSM